MKKLPKLIKNSFIQQLFVSFKDKKKTLLKQFCAKINSIFKILGLNFLGLRNGELGQMLF
jgi:hypothetical protein